jgi:hypothetical protein
VTKKEVYAGWFTSVSEAQNRKDMGSSANDQSNLTKVPKQGGNAH